MDYGILPLECGQIDYNNKIGEAFLVQAKDILITLFTAYKYAYSRYLGTSLNYFCPHNILG